MFTTSRLCPALAVLLASLASAAPSAWGRSDRTLGPPLSEPPSALRAALECSEAVEGAKRDPVLLVHGIAINAEESWGWGYRKALPEQGFPTCSVSLPDRRMEDIQRASEYVVYAIRRMAVLSGRPVAVVAHSGGAMEALWALRFWPDLPALVSDHIGLAGSIHGTKLANLLCRDPRGCAPAVWQASQGSRLLGALHAARPPQGPAYTTIASRFDEIVFPAPESSQLDGARNVVIQDVCPARPVEHATILGDLVTYRLVVDALTHPGPTDPARLPASVCLEGGMLPDHRVVTGLANFIAATTGLSGRRVAEEPPLRCYADPACHQSPAQRKRADPRLRIAVAPRRVAAGHRARFRFRVTAGGRRVVNARLRFATERVHTNRHGRAALVIRLPRPRLYRVLARRTGFRPGRAIVKAVRRPPSAAHGGRG